MCEKTNSAKRPEADLCARRQTQPKYQRQACILQEHGSIWYFVTAFCGHSAQKTTPETLLHTPG